MGMSGMEKTGRGDITSGGVGTPDGPGTAKLWSSGTGTVGLGSDAMEMPSSWWATMWMLPCWYSRDASAMKMHQGNNLRASMVSSPGITPLREWHQFGWSSVPSSWPVWLSCAHAFFSQFLGLLDKLTLQLSPGLIGFMQKLKGRVIPQPFCLNDWQDDIQTHFLSVCRQGGCLILPQSGCTLPEVMEVLARGLTERWDWKGGDPPLNYPIGTLEDGGTSLSPLLPPRWGSSTSVCTEWKQPAQMQPV